MSDIVQICLGDFVLLIEILICDLLNVQLEDGVAEIEMGFVKKLRKGDAGSVYILT